MAGITFTVEEWACDKVIPYARNARQIPDSAVSKVAASIKEFGWQQPIVVDPDGVILAGHTRLMAAKKLGMTTVPIKIAHNLTPGQAKAFRLMDNRSHEEATWDEKLLALELDELRTSFDYNLLMTGFDAAEIAAFKLGEEEKPNSLLSRMNITIADPVTETALGEVWRVMDKHTLVIASVIEDWPMWKPYLRDDALFCPHPGPFVLFSEKAMAHPLVLVQPDPYIAGHLLDRVIEIHGKDAIALEPLPEAVAS